MNGEIWYMNNDVKDPFFVVGENFRFGSLTSLDLMIPHQKPTLILKKIYSLSSVTFNRCKSSSVILSNAAN